MSDSLQYQYTNIMPTCSVTFAFWPNKNKLSTWWIFLAGNGKVGLCCCLGGSTAQLICVLWKNNCKQMAKKTNMLQWWCWENVAGHSWRVFLYYRMKLHLRLFLKLDNVSVKAPSCFLRLIWLQKEITRQCFCSKKNLSDSTIISCDIFMFHPHAALWCDWPGESGSAWSSGGGTRWARMPWDYSDCPATGTTWHDEDIMHYDLANV